MVINNYVHLWGTNMEVFDGIISGIIWIGDDLRIYTSSYNAKSFKLLKLNSANRKLRK